jgi:hypothetical protein
MTRDWLLTLLVMSPFLLLATTVVVAVIRKLIQIERTRLTAESSAPLQRTGSVRETE